MKTTIADIARLAEVSKATVSAVLNDRPGISEETRRRVLDIIKKANYRPNAIARSLSNQATRSIGLVIKEIDNPYFARITKGVFDACGEQGYTVLLGSSELSPEQELKSVETLTTRRVEGLIVSPLQGPDVDFSYLSDLIRDRFPLVTLGSVKNFSTPVVDIDNAAAACKAVSHLIEAGHSDIAYFAGPTHSGHSDERLEGFRRAFMDHGLPVPPDSVQRAGSYIGNGTAAGMEHFGESGRRPTAVFCYNDLVAIGLINALTDLGLRVPADVAVVGFDDLDVGRYHRIPLTTVRVPSYEIGRAAVESLFRRIRSPDTGAPERTWLETELVVRDSSSRRT